MKLTLKLEELGMLLTGIIFFGFLPFSWWWFLILFLLPDIGMLGYLIGNKAGAISYNLFHHEGLAVLIGIIGTYLGSHYLQLAGIILFSHASFDRILGYGLKYARGFKFTHLGEIGK
ncbi:uncharacterized protein DUF4260 [Gillisia sp. Hel_I_86]|uniref:DUF4260 domain-containing protein n=1 Tax=Gillisia sp. Hel_I_86 TaxID=1249981 RepID=UPI0011995A0E|nr:DUF4260 domain-containing protein [Gillisia sp. Hel_I_86]TVZ25806.1 uncharacterized protein DUF4260 [Gillisia sp. Hel_I_86]